MPPGFKAPAGFIMLSNRSFLFRRCNTGIGEGKSKSTKDADADGVCFVSSGMRLFA